MEIQELIDLGDDPALAFLNSVIRSGRHATELLTDGAAYLDWLERAGLLEADDRQGVAARFDESDLDAVAREAVDLREWLRPVVTAWATAERPTLPVEAQQHLNEILASDRRYLTIEDNHRAPRVTDRRHWQAPGQLLVPPTAAAARLLTSTDRDRVRACEAAKCTLWFYDRTKSHRRRWCSMAICGNQAKARTHRERTMGT